MVGKFLTQAQDHFTCELSLPQIQPQACATRKSLCPTKIYILRRRRCTFGLEQHSISVSRMAKTVPSRQKGGILHYATVVAASTNVHQVNPFTPELQEEQPHQVSTRTNR